MQVRGRELSRTPPCAPLPRIPARHKELKSSLTATKMCDGPNLLVAVLSCCWVTRVRAVRSRLRASLTRDCMQFVCVLPRLPAMFAAVLLVVGTAPRAWDAERMSTAAQKFGPNAVAGVRALQPVLVSAHGADETMRLQAINHFFNQRLAFRDDIESWGRSDCWASPLEALGKGQGDGEDFAIAKYFSLLAAGTPAAKLRMVYARARIGGSGGPTRTHMVLAYYSGPGAEPLILDNLVADIRPASGRPDLEPVFSFNSEGAWRGVGGASAGDPVAKLSRWRDVMTRAAAEGFQ
jgi:predicted transglutaminase-like cysteine proteinase